MHKDVQFLENIYAHLKFTVYGCKQTYTRVLQCSPASVGLAQARPNYVISSESRARVAHARYHLET